MMTKQHEPKSTMIRYLLGQMSDQERSSFEEQYQKDSELFFELSETENDLIDLYALGVLSESEQEKMRTFLADPDRMKRLAFARTLASYPNPGLESTRLGVPEVPARSLFWQGPRQFALQAVTAVATAVMIVGISWLFVADRNLRRELEALRNQQSSATSREQALQQQINILTRELEQISTSTKEIDQTPLLAQNTVSFSLSSDVLRGDGSAPTLKIPSSARFVVLKSSFPGYASSGYGLSLETADGNPVWRQEHASGRFLDRLNTQLTIKLPSRILKDGDYVLRVTTTVDQKTEDVAGYSFRVIRR